MIGVELNKPCKSLYTEALKNGLVINVTADSVIRLLPPMIMTDQEAQQVVSILAPLIKDFQYASRIWLLDIFLPYMTFHPLNLIR